MTQHYYALIMAGGGGTRLWPLSRQATPKQMLPLVSEQKSMFRVTVERLQPLLPPERVFVVAGQKMIDQLRADVPEIPAENYIAEPFGRNSGPAVALGSLMIAERDPDAIIATLASDHHIADTAKFREVLAAAAPLAADDQIVTLGISPAYPAVEFGYIKRGEKLGTYRGIDGFRADNFTEKPDRETAIQFLASGLYSWNSGMFIWSARHVLAEFQRQQPEIHALLEQIRAHIGQPDFSTTLNAAWEQMPNIPVDYAIMEHAPDIVVFPVDIGWSDIGSWSLLFDILDKDSGGNVLRGNGVSHLPLATANTLILSDRLVVTIGVDDLVIVDTDDVVMVCHRDRAQDVRQVVQQLRDRGDNKYL